jgi:hypothetical protein
VELAILAAVAVALLASHLVRSRRKRAAAPSREQADALKAP